MSLEDIVGDERMKQWQRTADMIGWDWSLEFHKKLYNDLKNSKFEIAPDFTGPLFQVYGEHGTYEVYIEKVVWLNDNRLEEPVAVVVIRPGNTHKNLPATPVKASYECYSVEQMLESYDEASKCLEIFEVN